jgi:predicted O-linked N-acetylglucosamine transferase (SPINDLY family)
MESKNNLAAALRRAEDASMTALEVVGAVDTLRSAYGPRPVVDLYRVWLAAHPGDALEYAILFNYGVMLTELDELDRAREAFERSTALNPDFVPSYINLGRLLERRGLVSQSVTEWNKALEKLAGVNGMAITHKTTALNQMARVLEANNQDETAESLLRQSLDVDPGQREVAQHYLAARQRLCAWPIVAPWDRASRGLLMKSISPLSMAVYTDDPMLQLACSAHYNQRDVGEPAGVVTSHWAASEAREGAPLRIGYVSSDLREHAIGFLMAELFSLHDRAKVEVFVYYCGVVPDDAMMRRIKGTVDHWVSIAEMDDHAAARRLADDGIQILVDINGYTRDGRVKMIAERPAPVIVNWLGYPGTMASPYHHYIIADDWIVPPGSEKYYAEKVLRLPCYQPNDRKRTVAERQPTRAEAGLPENAMVYCCFNGTQKISRFTFERWLTILNRVPGSVLWLLAGTDAAHKNLRAIAEAHGVDGARIIFADKMANPQHLARYPLADLFLDTSPYGAHTTASDSLWMGVPVLTLNGRSFASRVCGSLVRAAGLPELACASAEEYVDRAVALGKDREALLQYRARLAASRDTCDLFNTPKLVAHLEDLYAQMWQAYKNDALPQPDLTQLDAYLDVGSRQDHDAQEVQTMADYEAWWQANLAAYDRYRPLAADGRLWPTATKERKRA